MKGGDLAVWCRELHRFRRLSCDLATRSQSSPCSVYSHPEVPEENLVQA